MLPLIFHEREVLIVELHELFDSILQTFQGYQLADRGPQEGILVQ